MRLVTQIICLLCFMPADLLRAQAPTLPMPPSLGAPPQIDLVIKPDNQPSPLQQTSMNTGPVKPGDKVRVLHGTYIRSGPGEQAYSCGKLETGSLVTVLEFPAPGSDYTTIAAPDNCYSLIPESVIYHMIRPKNLFTEKQKTLTNVETLIDSEEPTENYLSSKYTLPKGSLVSVITEKKIRILGKEKVYCVIRIGGKEKRFVRTADLEGVAEAAKAASPPVNANPYGRNPGYTDHRASNEPLYGSPLTSQASYDQENLPPYLLSQVQAADYAYQKAMRYGAWEDARMKYQHLLECEVLSIRILAKNRLEFISEWQKNPPVVTTAMSPNQGVIAYPTVNHEPWVPGSIAPARPGAPVSTAALPSSVAAVPAVPKDIVIRPTQPASSPPNNALNIPTYQGNTPAKTQPVTQPATTPQAPPAAAKAAPATTTASPRMKVSGRLNLAVQFTGSDRLYYLTNSQGFMTYYVRGVANSGIRLNDYLGKTIEVEGWGIQAVIDGQTKPQINVDRLRPLQ